MAKEHLGVFHQAIIVVVKTDSGVGSRLDGAWWDGPVIVSRLVNEPW